MRFILGIICWFVGHEYTEWHYKPKLGTEFVEPDYNICEVCGKKLKPEEPLTNL